MKERIRQLLEHYSVSPAEFAAKLGVQRSAVSHILSGRNNPGLEFLQKILTAFPQVSADWLLLGTGELVRNDLATAPTATKSDSPGNDPAQKSEITHQDNTEDRTETQADEKKRNEPRQVQVVKTKNRDLKETPVHKIVFIYADGTFDVFNPSE